MMTIYCKDKDRTCPEDNDVCCCECEKNNRDGSKVVKCIMCCMKPLVDGCKKFEEVTD